MSEPEEDKTHSVEYFPISTPNSGGIGPGPAGEGKLWCAAIPSSTHEYEWALNGQCPCRQRSEQCVK